MKNVLFIFFLIATTSAFAQSGFGVKGGLNYADNGKMELNDLTDTGEDILQRNGERKTGYHLGVFYRASIGGFYLKPELLYTRTKSSYDYNAESKEYAISKIDLPLLLGMNILGPVHIFAGPSFQYLLENDLQGISLEEVEKDFTIGAQLGLGIQLGGVGVDVRYERGLTENQAEVLDLNNPEGVRRIDTRPSQFIVSLSLNL